ncbi:pseudouridine synthase [Roridomyces roridus]|uniref:21S rRNA pseudouridine(2819) synthase n=1 Tax=Roridomyces roridus TaxID=1738132 RepID=A0AAD7BTH0_9AGAR|nr:pseudouridine synthase [Roridomyces roridus]
MNRVLYIDRSIIVLNKPPGLVSQLHETLRRYVRPEVFGHSFKCVELRHGFDLATTPYPVHRLDKGTTGCLVFARSKSAARELSMQFRTRVVDKTYLALVSTRLLEKAGQIRTPLKYLDGRAALAMENEPDGQLSETDWELVASSPTRPLSLLRLKLLTGHKHQLRIHLARVLNAPILGDSLYSPTPQITPPDRIFLHASQLSLLRYRPLGGKKRFKIRLVAPLPPDFVRVCLEAGIPIDEREQLGGLAKSESGKDEDYEFIPEIPEVNGLWFPRKIT